MSIKINNWKEALLGKTRLGKIAMVIFFGLLLLTIGSCMFGCQTAPSTEQMLQRNGADLSAWPKADQTIWMQRMHGNARKHSN